jgi:non-heme chloroperoxidase
MASASMLFSKRLMSTMRKYAAIALLVNLISVAPVYAEYLKVSDDLTLHYEQAGKGPTTILFIPGWTMSTKVFERQIEHFRASTRFRAITYDPRGQGLSSKTLDGHTYRQHGRDLAAFIDRLALNNIVLAGWSNGVLEMMAYVNQFGTSKLKALVLLDGTPKALGKDNTKEWVWYSFDDQDRSRKKLTIDVLENRPEATIEFAKWMLDDASPRNIAWVDNIAGQTPNFIAALTNETGAYVDYESDLKGLNRKLPMLFVMRDEWRQIVTDLTKANAFDAELVIMGKHLMFWEHSEQFNAALDHFLDRLN